MDYIFQTQEELDNFNQNMCNIFGVEYRKINLTLETFEKNINYYFNNSNAIKSHWEDPNSNYNTEEYKQKRRMLHINAWKNPNSKLNADYFSENQRKRAFNQWNDPNSKMQQRKRKYVITDNNGVVYHTTNITKFCKENKLSAGSMCMVATGKRKHYKGWICVYSD